MVVKHEDSPSHGPMATESAQEGSFAEQYHSAGDGHAISSVLTDGDGADSHLSSHMTSQFTAANSGSQFTTNAVSSNINTHAVSSPLHPPRHPLSRSPAVPAAPDAMSCRLQSTDNWLPVMPHSAVAEPSAMPDVAAVRQEHSEVSSRAVHHEELGSTAAGTQVLVAGALTAEQRMRARMAAVEGHAPSIVAQRREQELSMDFDLTDALMSKDISKLQGSSSGRPRVPQLREEGTLPSFVDDDALSIALGVLLAVPVVHTRP